MRLHCPKCAGEIPAKDVNIRSLVAKCDRCDNVFSFQHETVTPANISSVPIIKKPAFIQREETSEFIKFQWGWKSIWAIPILVLSPIAYIWLLMLELGSTQSQPLGVRGDVNWVILGLYFCLLLFSLYWAVAHLINRTVIYVDHGTIRVQHKPLAWRGQTIHFVSRHVQLYTGKHLSGGRYPQERIAVNVLKQNGKHERVIENLGSIEHALYLEQEIEAFLGITDQPVRGELSRGL